MSARNIGTICLLNLWEFISTPQDPTRRTLQIQGNMLMPIWLLHTVHSAGLDLRVSTEATAFKQSCFAKWITAFREKKMVYLSGRQFIAIPISLKNERFGGLHKSHNSQVFTGPCPKVPKRPTDRPVKLAQRGSRGYKRPKPCACLSCWGEVVLELVPIVSGTAVLGARFKVTYITLKGLFYGLLSYGEGGQLWLRETNILLLLQWLQWLLWLPWLACPDEKTKRCANFLCLFGVSTDQRGDAEFLKHLKSILGYMRM